MTTHAKATSRAFFTPTDYPHVWRSAFACLAVEAWACIGYYLLVTRLIPRLV